MAEVSAFTTCGGQGREAIVEDQTADLTVETYGPDDPYVHIRLEVGSGEVASYAFPREALVEAMRFVLSHDRSE